MAQRTFAFIKLQWAACQYSHSLRRSELQLLALSAIELEPTPIGQSLPVCRLKEARQSRPMSKLYLGFGKLLNWFALA
jgi:hypothetical protein